MAVPGSVIGVRERVGRIILVQNRDLRYDGCGHVDHARRESRIRSQHGDAGDDWNIVHRTGARRSWGHVLVGKRSGRNRSDAQRDDGNHREAVNAADPFGEVRLAKTGSTSPESQEARWQSEDEGQSGEDNRAVDGPEQRVRKGAKEAERDGRDREHGVREARQQVERGSRPPEEEPGENDSREQQNQDGAYQRRVAVAQNDARQDRRDETRDHEDSVEWPTGPSARSGLFSGLVRLVGSRNAFLSLTPQIHRTPRTPILR